MTPGARVAAAIAVLDQINEGTPAEQALTRWGRASRFAGSKDRAAVRDHVFDVLRAWRSTAVLGGAETGRARMLGLLRRDGADLNAVFTGAGHAPPPPTAAEQAVAARNMSVAEAWDLPDFVVPLWQAALGATAKAAALETTRRAPVTLRARGVRGAVRSALSDAGITAVDNPVCAAALTVTDGARRVRHSTPFADGLVELQDAGSQAITQDLRGPGRALDYCAGGGGKALALADLGWDVTAHDIDFERMSDLPARAQRAGVTITRARPGDVSGTYDLVLCDAPCSGSGAWRRAPQGKWALTPARLAELTQTQETVLTQAARHVAPGGVLVYATCSVLRAENEERVAAWVSANPDWRVERHSRWPINAWSDGFFSAHLRRVSD